jgi:protein-S-isoprenylcysteine O-methyltransferase Ste14
MTVVAIVLAGIIAFVTAAVALGAWLRRHPTRENAEWASRILHFLFFALLNLLPLAVFVSPGIFVLDEVAGLPPLRPRVPWALAGAVLAVPALYLLAVTNRALRALGSGANAFRLTRQVVNADVYGRTRNPMSLGFYLWITAVGLLFGSTTFTAIAVLAIVPAHLVFLRWFEEVELPLRLGPSYEIYRRRTPFLIPRLRT